ncbi:MAG: pantetheine-phosphate adenylyltransferase [Desulfobacter postgatei]|uniref:Phosphopantetheine adenylyltransferase n=1 Tax=Desulfobacter postgatei TaxID=2293 RepID=A0A2G6MSY4_9BACT|nr:MAG: pantetheine-phosphate adenylyltransferase [Desulfobacter postgatei]
MTAPERKIAIYPGSFDPLTNGHLDVIRRAQEIFDHVIVGVLNNTSKKTPLFSPQERVSIIRECFQDPSVKVDSSTVEVETFDGLLVEYARIKKAVAIIRGMRALSDFENEFQMALMNRKLNREVQSVFLMTGSRWIFTSSSIIKEVARFGGDISDMVPKPVERRVKEKFDRIVKSKKWQDRYN